MQLEQYHADKLREEILGHVKKYLDLDQYRVFFFGSRVTGRAHERSDIDVGIEGPAPVPWHILARIKGEIAETPTLYTIELVDFKRVSSGFRKVANERREYLQPHL